MSAAVPHDASGAARGEGAPRARPHGVVPAPPPQPVHARAAASRLPRHAHEAKGMLRSLLVSAFFIYFIFKGLLLHSHDDSPIVPVLNSMICDRRSI